MKHPKWLLIIVLVILVINIAFYTIWYAFDVQGRIKTQLELYLSNTLSGRLKIGKLSINERLITINDISFQNNQRYLSIQVKQVRISYSLIGMALTGFKLNNAIKQISVFNPNIDFIYDYQPKQKAAPIKIPDLTPLFDKLSIQKGKLHVLLSAEIAKQPDRYITFEETLTDVNILINNTKASEINLSATSKNSGTFKVVSKLDKGLISLINCKIEKYHPQKISLTGLDRISTEMSVTLNYTKTNKLSDPEFSVNSFFWYSNTEFDKYQINVPYIHIKGNQELLQFGISNSKVNNSEFSAIGYLTDILDKPVLNSMIDVNTLELSDYIQELSGNMSGNLTIKGEFNDLSAESTFKIPALIYHNQAVENIALEAKYSGNNLDFSTNNFTWNNQVSELHGAYNTFNQQLSLFLNSNPVKYSQDFNLSTALSADINLNKLNTSAKILINDFGFYNADIRIPNMSGYVDITRIGSGQRDFDLDLVIQNTQGLYIEASGGLAQPSITASVKLDSISVSQYLPILARRNIDTTVSGVIKSELHNSLISGNTILSVEMTSPKTIAGDVLADFNYNIDTKKSSIRLSTNSATAQSIPFDFELQGFYENKTVFIDTLLFDNVVSAKGKIDLNDYYNSELFFVADNLDFNKYWNMFNPSKVHAPIDALISLELDYNSAGKQLIHGTLKAESIKVSSLKPVTALFSIHGTTTTLDAQGEITSSNLKVLSLDGSFRLKPIMEVSLKSQFDKINLQDFLNTEDYKGTFSGSIDWNATFSPEFKQVLSFNLNGDNLQVMGFSVDKILAKATQYNEYLVVDTLLVEAPSLINVSAKGAIDYNVLTSNYTNGNRSIDVIAQGDVLKILKKYVPYFHVSKGYLTFAANISTDENGLNLRKGLLSLKNGTLKLKDQLEAITDIDFEGQIINNVLSIDKFTSHVGQGRLYIRNAIDPGEDNFFVGPLNLGYFLVRTGENGIQVSIPDYIPPNTAATAILKGQGSSEATIKGPFDDMEFKGEIIASNVSVVYPANTKNIMQLINLFQRKQEAKEQLPLPFTLDLLIIAADNVQYVTYPAQLICQPGSFLRLIYDGNIWSAEEANFVSEKGTLDFYGTTFKVDNVRVEINSSNDIVAVNGTFTKHAPDGTLITLTVTTDPQKGGDVFNQLDFKLTSDNPQDVSPSRILSRLRYNRPIDELSPEQRQSLLQDEAMQLVSTSVNTTYVSQFLNPIENKIRRFLKLDSFSISTGFVQNLFVEFTSSGEQPPAGTETGNLNADIMQFSSSIFLNNLSISMGKYLWSKMFIDYEIHLQETTDLAYKTKLDLYHNASVRFNLPWKLKLVYTFSIRPVQEANSHEISLQRSFRF